MPNLGAPELVIILLLLVLLFGAKKLPELGGAIGKSIKSFKRGVNDAKHEDTGEDAKSETATEPARELPAPGATHVSTDGTRSTQRVE